MYILKCIQWRQFYLREELLCHPLPLRWHCSYLLLLCLFGKKIPLAVTSIIALLVLVLTGVPQSQGCLWWFCR